MAITPGFDPADIGSIPVPPANRETRRYKRSKIINKRLTKLRRLYIDRPEFKVGKLHKWSGARCSNPKCWMCRNPRQVFGTVTIPEIKANVSYKQQLKELMEDGQDGNAADC